MLSRLPAVALAAVLALPADAEQWPARGLRILTGTPPGGSPDFVSRLLAEKLGDRLGQPVLVEHSASTGVAAWNTVAKSQPDGYLLTMLTGAFSARAAVAKALPYDPIRDFAFITLVSGYPMVVATAPNSPINSFADLIARAKAAPFSVTYAMNLPGSVHHLTGELINVEAGTSLRGIPYRGNTQMVQDLLGGRLDVISRLARSHSRKSTAVRCAAWQSRPAGVSCSSPISRRSPRRCPDSRSCPGSVLPRPAERRRPLSTG
jgi:tripartite-type tricarboxylate transporter receptor subunit TctC